MGTRLTPRMCAFCGEQGQDGTRFAAGFGVFIDEYCTRFFDEEFQSTPKGTRAPGANSAPLRRHPISDLSDEQVLKTLPRITDTAVHVNSFMCEWVEMIRDRKMSWTVIGNALGISRQAAWERFTRASGSEKDPGSR